MQSASKSQYRTTAVHIQQEKKTHNSGLADTRHTFLALHTHKTIYFLYK